jgi:CRP/FNR family transcriptional regulator
MTDDRRNPVDLNQRRSVNSAEGQAMLEGLDFFRDAPAEIQARFGSVAQHVRLEPGDLLFREGEVVTSFAAVASGSLRVFRLGATGREITLYHVRSQQTSLASMLSVLLGTPALATGQAEVATHVVLLPGAVMREWLRPTEAIPSFLFDNVARALVEVTDVLEALAFRTMESRLGALLIQHFAMGDVISMRHEDLASDLGTAREVVSLLLESFAKRGALELSRGHIALRDESILRAAIELAEQPGGDPGH